MKTYRTLLPLVLLPFLAFGCKSHRDDILAAVKSNDSESVKLLAKDPKQLTKVDPFGKSALHLAAYKGDERIVAILLDSGADLEAVDAQGNTPLALAVIHDRVENVKLLVRRGANAHSVNRSGVTPLDLAKLSSEPEIAAELNKASRK